jgi:cathepsin B
MFKLAVITFLFSYAYAAYYEDTAPQWIAKINSDPSHGFKAGYNPFLAGKSLDAMKRLMGTKLDGKSYSRARAVEHDLTTKATLPAAFQVGKDKWSSCAATVNYVKDQADCGSCWAVAASSTIADRICIANSAAMESGDKLNEPKPVIDMSAAQIMDCCYYCGQGCGGGYPIDAMRYYSYDGVVTGGWYGSNCGCKPYEIPPCPASGCSGPEAQTPTCTQSCRSGFARTFTQDKHKGTDHYTIRGAANIQAEIYAKGSVECAFSVYENFMHYTSGVYTAKSGQLLGGHAVRVIGWGTEGGVPYWTIANSWNTTWGIQGFFKFKRGIDLCGMESQCVASVAKGSDSNYQLQC